MTVEELKTIMMVVQTVAIIGGGLAFYWKVSAIHAKWDFMLGLMWADYCQRKGIGDATNVPTHKPKSTGAHA